ncbi:hypothetical protein XENOCAPTIV_026643 [Xenoophorus captivus]|uniref:Uncharacterized protein n=1 Tax=Xenoophorus captivus TaxID=1517983 RepID=A0ABV0R508_9TELE
MGGSTQWCGESEVWLRSMLFCGLLLKFQAFTALLTRLKCVTVCNVHLFNLKVDQLQGIQLHCDTFHCHVW